MLSTKLKDGLNAAQLTRIARLGAFALFLSTIEYMIPKPVPFMRVGLANVPIMISLQLLSPEGFIVLVLLKVLSQALVNGTIFSYIILFSLGGSTASSLVMYGLYHGASKHFSFLGISIAGAMTSNIVQLVMSRYIVFGPSVWLIAPPFLIMGLITSIILGLFVERFVHSSLWFAQQSSQQSDRIDESSGDLVSRSIPGETTLWDLRLITGLLVLPAFLLQPTLTGSIILAVLFIIYAVVHNRSFRLLPNLILLFSVVFANLLQKNGLVLTEVFGYPITLGALRIGVKKACTLIGMIYLSQFMVSNKPQLPGRMGNLISLQLYYFQRLTELWKNKNGEEKGFFTRLDRILFSLDSIRRKEIKPKKIYSENNWSIWYLFLILISWGGVAFGAFFG